MKLINISSWGLRRSDVWIQWEGGDGLFIFIFHLKFSTTRGALSLDSSFIFDSMPTRSGIHILWSQQSGWIPFWMGVSIVQQDSSKHSNSIISSVPSRLTRHSVRASAIASPETSQSRGVTGFGTGCGKWPLGRPSPFLPLLFTNDPTAGFAFRRPAERSQSHTSPAFLPCKL